MLIADILSFWYTTGWKKFSEFLLEKMKSVLSFFSISALIKTLFAPFRQIAVASTETTAVGRFFDHLVSRFMGALVRIFLMLIGSIILIFEAVLSLVLLILWPVVPFSPIIFLVLALTGVSI